MAESLDDRYRRLLAKHLVMNEETRATLLARGVTEDRELSLDFAFVAPDRPAAEALKGILAEQTDYQVEIQSSGALRRTWGRCHEDFSDPAPTRVFPPRFSSTNGLLFGR